MSARSTAASSVPKSSWVDCSKRMPREGAPVLVQLANHDIVVAFRCSGWVSGFFTSRALKPRSKNGVPRRKVEQLYSPAVRWREFGELPEPVPPLVAKELGARTPRLRDRDDSALRSQLTEKRAAGLVGAQ